MKIAFDVQPLLQDDKSGIGYDEHELITRMIRQHSENEYYLEYFGKKSDVDINTKRISKYETDYAMQISCTSFMGRLSRKISKLLYIPYSIFFPEERDVTHFFNYIIPPGVKGKKVVTIHDMGFKVYPETVHPRTRLILNLTLKKSIKRADVIVTDSEFSRKEICKFYNVNQENIKVVPCGVDCERFHPNYINEDIELVKMKYGIEKRSYILFLGSIEPRKNLYRVVQAYCGLAKRINQEQLPIMVMAGGKGWLNDDIYQEIEQSGLKKQFLFPGYIEEEDLPLLYAGALFFCFPSLYEGFGIPPLEAMACGTPVLTSDGNSLIEVVEDSAVTVDPLDVKAIEDGMYQLCVDENLRKTYREKGILRAKDFSWENAMEKLYDIYEGLSI